MIRRAGPGTGGFRRRVGILARGAAGIADVASQFLLAATVAIVFGIVVLRYGFHHTPAWGEEIALRFIIWFSFLGASLATRQGLHLGVEIFAAMLPDTPRRAVEIFSHLAVIGFGVFMIWAGTGMVVSTASQTLPATKLSVGYTSYLAIPVSGALIALQALAVAIGAGPERESLSADA